MTFDIHLRSVRLLGFILPLAVSCTEPDEVATTENPLPGSSESGEPTPADTGQDDNLNTSSTAGGDELDASTANPTGDPSSGETNSEASADAELGSETTASDEGSDCREIERVIELGSPLCTQADTEAACLEADELLVKDNLCCEDCFVECRWRPLVATIMRGGDCFSEQTESRCYLAANDGSSSDCGENLHCQPGDRIGYEFSGTNHVLYNPDGCASAALGTYCEWGANGDLVMGDDEICACPCLPGFPENRGLGAQE